MQAAVRCRWYRPMLHAYFLQFFLGTSSIIWPMFTNKAFSAFVLMRKKKPVISNTDRFLCFNGTISYTYFIYFRWFQFSYSDINWDVRWYLNSWIWLDTSHVISAFGCELNFVVCMNQRKPRKLILKKNPISQNFRLVIYFSTFGRLHCK
jgi:hypothetical protein